MINGLKNKNIHDRKFISLGREKRISEDIIEVVDILANYNKPFDINVFECFNKINNMSDEDLEEFYKSVSTNRKEDNSGEENFMKDLIDLFMPNI